MAVVKQILVMRGETSRIGHLFGVTSQTVREALRYRTESDLSEKIREEALRSGGKLTKIPVKITRV